MVGSSDCWGRGGLPLAGSRQCSASHLVRMKPAPSHPSSTSGETLRGRALGPVPDLRCGLQGPRAPPFVFTELLRSLAACREGLCKMPPGKAEAERLPFPSGADSGLPVPLLGTALIVADVHPYPHPCCSRLALASRELEPSRWPGPGMTPCFLPLSIPLIPS